MLQPPLEARYLPRIMTYECGGLNALSLEIQLALFSCEKRVKIRGDVDTPTYKVRQGSNLCAGA